MKLGEGKTPQGGEVKPQRGPPSGPKKTRPLFPEGKKRPPFYPLNSQKITAIFDIKVANFPLTLYGRGGKNDGIFFRRKKMPLFRRKRPIFSPGPPPSREEIISFKQEKITGGYFFCLKEIISCINS